MSSDRARDLTALVALTLAVMAFFWPLLLGQAWIPRGGGDLVSFLWPMYRFSARSLRSGVVPLWNPHLHGGAPFAADNQTGLFYPVNLLTFAAFGPPSYAVMEGLVVFHIWLAAVGMALLLRSLRLRRPAAVLGALAFALSDLFVTHIGNLNLNATAAWLPLVIWGARRSLDDQSPGWAAGAGSMLAVAALAGHAQMLIYLWLAFALHGLYHLGALLARGGHSLWSQLRKSAGLTLLTGAVGLGGAALMLLPAWRLAGHTGRGHLPYDEATRYALPPRALVGLIAPGFYGRGSARFWGPWERVEVGYAGVAALLLAALGVGLLVSRRLSGLVRPAASSEDREDGSRYRHLGFFALLIPLAFLLALGDHAPVYRILYRFLPTFDQIRAPARLILLSNLGMAVMAAYALDRLVAGQDLVPYMPLVFGLGAVAAALLLLALGVPLARSLPPPHRMLQATRSVIVAAGLLSLSGVLLPLARGRPWAAWLFVALLALDLIALGSTVEIDENNPTRGFHHPEVVAFLKQDPAPFRIESSAPSWQPDAALVHELYDIGGVYNPLAIAPYQAYRWAMGERGSMLYNLLGVKYVLVDKGRPPGDVRFELVASFPEIDLYRNEAALPRALFVTSHHVVSDHAEAWQAIHAPSFSPTKTVVLEQEGPQPIPEKVEGAQRGRIAFARYGLNAVELTVESPVSGWLVLSDVYYPGWRGTVDEQQTPVLRANYTFRAISVPAGHHTVEMVFAPGTWRVGLALSLATWLGLAGAVALKLFRERQRSRAEGPG